MEELCNKQGLQRLLHFLKYQEVFCLHHGSTGTNYLWHFCLYGHMGRKFFEPIALSSPTHSHLTSISTLEQVGIDQANPSNPILHRAADLVSLSIYSAIQSKKSEFQQKKKHIPLTKAFIAGCASCINHQRFRWRRWRGFWKTLQFSPIETM